MNYTLDQHKKALEKARAAGDMAAVQQIQSLIDQQSGTTTQQKTTTTDEGFIGGYTMEQHQAALAKAQAAGDTAAVQQIQQMMQGGGETRNPQAPWSLEEINQQIANLAGSGSTTAQRQLASWQTMKDTFYPESDTGSEAEKTEAKKKESAENVLSTLEGIYFGEAEGEKPLAYAEPGKFGSRLKGNLAQMQAYWQPGERSSEQERINVYNSKLESSLAALAKAGGDVGNIGIIEQMMQKKGLAQTSDTPSEAIYKFQTFRQKLGLPESETLKAAAAKYRPTKEQKAAIDAEFKAWEEKVKKEGISPETQKFLDDNNIQVKGVSTKKTAPQTKVDTQQNKFLFPGQKMGFMEAIQKMVGTPQARDKFMRGYKDTLAGKGTGMDKIPVLSELLRLASGVGGKIGEGVPQAIGGAATGNPLDVAKGVGKTGLSLYAPQAATPKFVAGGAGLSGILGLLTGQDPYEAAGEGAVGAAQTQGAMNLIGKIPGVNRILKPKATASAQKTKQLTQATKQGTEIAISKDAKDAANFILKQGSKESGYLQPAEKELLKKVVSNKTLTPSEADKMRMTVRTFARGATNNPLRGNEGQAYETIYQNIIGEIKNKVPKAYQEIKNQAELFASPRQLEKFEEPLQTYTRKAVGQFKDLPSTAVKILLLKQILGLDRFMGGGSSGGGESY